MLILAGHRPHLYLLQGRLLLGCPVSKTILPSSSRSSNISSSAWLIILKFWGKERWLNSKITITNKLLPAVHELARPKFTHNRDKKSDGNPDTTFPYLGAQKTGKSFKISRSIFNNRTVFSYDAYEKRENQYVPERKRILSLLQGPTG
jgi:hypothetical protein